MKLSGVRKLIWHGARKCITPVIDGVYAIQSFDISEKKSTHEHSYEHPLFSLRSSCICSYEYPLFFHSELPVIFNFHTLLSGFSWKTILVSVTLFTQLQLRTPGFFIPNSPVIPFRTPCMFFMSGDPKRSFRHGVRNKKVVRNVSFPAFRSSFALNFDVMGNNCCKQRAYFVKIKITENEIKIHINQWSNRPLVQLNKIC